VLPVGKELRFYSTDARQAVKRSRSKPLTVLRLSPGVTRRALPAS
jgi:hypothetical protein